MFLLGTPTVSRFGFPTCVGLTLRLAPSDGPCAGDEVDSSVFRNRKRGSNSLPKPRAALVAQRHGVARRRSLAPEKRGPVIVEITEVSGYVNRTDFDFGESGLREQFGEGRGLTDR